MTTRERKREDRLDAAEDRELRAVGAVFLDELTKEERLNRDTRFLINRSKCVTKPWPPTKGKR